MKLTQENIYKNGKELLKNQSSKLRLHNFSLKPQKWIQENIDNKLPGNSLKKFCVLFVSQTENIFYSKWFEMNKKDYSKINHQKWVNKTSHTL